MLATVQTYLFLSYQKNQSLFSLGHTIFFFSFRTLVLFLPYPERYNVSLIFNLVLLSFYFILKHYFSNGFSIIICYNVLLYIMQTFSAFSVL
jgi:hypothetical protein